MKPTIELPSRSSIARMSFMSRIIAVATAKVFLAVVVAFIVVPICARADTIIDTSGSWDGDPQDAVQPWGATSTTTYGQTFTVGGDTLLKSFSFNIWNTGDHAGNSAGPIPYAARVYQWDYAAQTAVGAALYLGSISAVPFTGGYQVETATPDINLVSGLQYVALFTTSGAWQGAAAPPAGAFWAAIFNSSDTMMADVYPGGGFVDTSGNDPNLLTSSKWDQVPGDLWFQADLAPAPVPEPASLSLLGIGLAAIWLKRRVRTRI